MRILGLSGLYSNSQFKLRYLPHASERQYRMKHVFDAAAALVTDDGIQAAVAEERLNGEKGSGAFPIEAIHCCLSMAGLAPGQLDYIAHGWSFEPYRAFFEGSDEFYRQQFYEVFSRSALLKSFHTLLPTFEWDDKVISVPHHLAHAASAFYPSGMKDALILVADGMGEMHSLTIAVGSREGIKVL